jgi:hypothetical protein
LYSCAGVDIVNSSDFQGGLSRGLARIEALPHPPGQPLTQFDSKVTFRPDSTVKIPPFKIHISTSMDPHEYNFNTLHHGLSGLAVAKRGLGR